MKDVMSSSQKQGYWMHRHAPPCRLKADFTTWHMQERLKKQNRNSIEWSLNFVLMKWSMQLYRLQTEEVFPGYFGSVSRSILCVEPDCRYLFVEALEQIDINELDCINEMCPHHPQSWTNLCEIWALQQMAGPINATLWGGGTDLGNQDPEKMRQGNGSECVIKQLIRTPTVVPIN